VLHVHTRYRYPGGEDQVVAAEKRLLEAAGIDVRQVLFDNAEIVESRSLLDDARLAASAVWSRDAHHRVAAELKTYRPDVVHVHNTFAAASPSVYSAAAQHRVPVVQTLHNYRLVCPAATAFRDGRVCTDCVQKLIPWPAVQHACVRDSRAQSAVVSATITLHRALGTYARKIDRYVALTSFQRDLMISGGLPGRKINVIPNFLEPDPGEGEAARFGVIFIGRLSKEKGILTLLDAATAGSLPLRVAGTGPLDEPVRQAAAAGALVYVGGLQPARVLEELKGAVALVVPSETFEGCPNVVLEAYATATPVIASRIGSLPELVTDGVTGLLFEPRDPADLTRRIKWAIDHPEAMLEMGRAGRQAYESRFRGGGHLAQLLNTYQEAAAAASRR
jgi:glycosyltransferase involved in cell wall biosynthesis